MSNPSTIYANIFVDELIRAGLKHVCFVPGSRHTPLILAFARHKDEIKIYSHLDERSASFFALGLALALDEPVAMVCTSGSAGANFFPAIVEAHQSRVPLIVLTADRPPELRHSGANQTIDQIKMFGDFVLWFVDAALPEENPPAVALRNLRTLAARAFAKANGIRKGVVHINLPFRKPLEPDTVEQLPISGDSENITHTNIVTGMQWTNGLDRTAELVHILKLYDKGIIICGGRIHPNLSFMMTDASAKLSYPILAETTSMMRHHNPQDYGSTALGGFEEFLPFAPKPDVVIRFGDVPISIALNRFIEESHAKYVIHVSEDTIWADDSHLVNWQLHSQISTVLELIRYRDIRQKDSALSTQYSALETNTWQTIDHEINTGAYFDGGVVYDVVDLIPDGSTLFAGNSLPVRHLDQFGKPTNKRIFAYANRGASGIDGNISTALGAGAARPDKPLVAIIGDITFYHDMNGLLAVHRCGVPVTIVLLNNDGGGIFHRLPINKFDPDFTDYWVTPHGLDYSHSAKLYGLDYVRADSRDEFRQAFSESVNSRASTVIEFHSNAQQDLKRRNEIVAAVHARLKELKI